MKTDGNKIGKSLIDHASELERGSRGSITEFFPFIYQASGRMSARAISEWLEKEHGVKISFVTIAKALREPGRYWMDFAWRVEAAASMIEEKMDGRVNDFLFNEKLFGHVVDEYLRNSVSGYEHRDFFDDSDLGAQVRLLNEQWFVLDPATRRECAPFIENQQAARLAHSIDISNLPGIPDASDDNSETAELGETVQTKNTKRGKKTS